MGAVLGPVVGGLDDEQSAAVFQRLTPKMAILLASLALVTTAGGITLALRLGLFPNADPWLAVFSAVNAIPVLLLLGWRLSAWRDWRWQVTFGVATLGLLAWVALTIDEFLMTTPAIAVALGLVTILSIQGFGYLLPGGIQVYRELRSSNPDSSVIAAIGKQNAALGGVQGLVQLLLILDMVYLQWGGFPF